MTRIIVCAEKVHLKNHLYFDSWLSSRHRSHGSSQLNLFTQVLWETDRTSLLLLLRSSCPRSWFSILSFFSQGYLALTLLMHENSDIIRLVVNSIRKDLDDMNETTNCLALHAIANIGGADMAEALAPDVHRLLISPWASDHLSSSWTTK